MPVPALASRTRLSGFTMPSESNASMDASDAISASKTAPPLIFSWRPCAESNVISTCCPVCLPNSSASARTASCTTSIPSTRISAPRAMPLTDISIAAIRIIRTAARIVCSPRNCLWSRFLRRRGLMLQSMQYDAKHERVQRLTGIALMCGAISCFAVLDAMAKYLNLHMSTFEVAWAPYPGAFLFPFIVSNPWTHPHLAVPPRPALQIGRSMLLLGSTLCNFMALRYLQLDQATALMFSTPFFVAALSGPILGEWVRWRRWTAIAVGFAGVLVVTRPGTGSFQPAALLSLTGAVCYAFYAITTRILARTDSNATTLFYSNIV